MELIGTNWVVAKPQAVKFYIPPELMKDAEAIFDRQGVKLSEGITRLIRHLVEAPEEMKLIVLGQAHGDAAVTLAQSILAKRKGRAGHFPSLAAKHAEPRKKDG